MHVLEAKVSNVRSIESLSWHVPFDQAAGWHVILGDNGAGKSSLLRAIALVLIGHDNALALRLPWENWLRRSKEQALIDLVLRRHGDFDNVGEVHSNNVGARIEWSGPPGTSAWILPADNVSFKSNANGWFSAGYGPFRRFSGADPSYTRTIASYPRLARHLSLFDERVALTETLEWLRQLQFEKLEEGDRPGHLLDQVKAFVNQPGFLPFGARLDKVSSKEVIFVDGNGCEVPIEEMSDGYRSILSMTFDLIRQLAREYGTERLFSSNDPTKIIVPGVVLIDEVDAHLHPTWQRRIGLWFRRHFPNMQFIVTTHSPLVCQAAEVGTVFRLPAPGNSEEPHMVTGQELDRLLYGDILDAYGTGLFGQGVTRSASSRRHLERLASLNVKEINEGLTSEEEQEQVNLRAALPTAAHVLSADDAADS